MPSPAGVVAHAWRGPVKAGALLKARWPRQHLQK